MLVNTPSNFNMIFSRKALRDFINGKLQYQYKENITYEEYINMAYKELSKHYRNEYYYKNALLNRRLLGVHSINTAVALAELSIGKSIADFVLLNGDAVVYEIKTELDDFSRLDDQLQDYYKAFKNVYVVTAESKIDQLKGVLGNSPAGIIALRKNGSLSRPIKVARSYSGRLDHAPLFKLLRKQEYLNITEKLFSEIPNVKPVFLYEECFNLFKTLNLETAYEEVMGQLKLRNIKEKEAFKKVPEAIKGLVYFEDLSKKEYDKLFMLLKKQMGG